MNVQMLLVSKGNFVHDIPASATVLDCIEKLNDRRIGALLVKDSNGNLEGLVSERDLLRSIGNAPNRLIQTTVAEIMTPALKLIVVGADDPLEKVMSIMTANKIRHVPVMEKKQVIGIVSIGDVVKALLNYALEENEQMKMYVSGCPSTVPIF